MAKSPRVYCTAAMLSVLSVTALWTHVPFGSLCAWPIQKLSSVIRSCDASHIPGFNLATISAPAFCAFALRSAMPRGSVRCTSCSFQMCCGSSQTSQPATSRFEFVVPWPRPRAPQHAQHQWLCSRRPNTPESSIIYEKVFFASVSGSYHAAGVGASQPPSQHSDSEKIWIDRERHRHGGPASDERPAGRDGGAERAPS